MDDVELGRFPAQCERPEPVKFAWPIVLLPELFTTPRHLALVFGYLASIGWEVFVPDLRAAFGKGATLPLEKLRFNDLAALAGEAIDGIGRDAIVLGHGVGGLVALKLSEHRRVKAAVAYAPLVPGFRTPLVGGIANRLAMMWRLPLQPPRGRKTVRIDRRCRSVHSRRFDKCDGAGFGCDRGRRNGRRDRVCGAGQSRAAPDRSGRLGHLCAADADLAGCRVDQREVGDDRRPRALADWRARARTRDQRDAAIPGASARPGFAAALS